MLDIISNFGKIFDSLIITNDRPYVSCGLDLAATCPGLIDFAQFELINKVMCVCSADCNQENSRWCGMHKT